MRHRWWIVFLLAGGQALLGVSSLPQSVSEGGDSLPISAQNATVQKQNSSDDVPLTISAISAEDAAIGSSNKTSKKKDLSDPGLNITKTTLKVPEQPPAVIVANTTAPPHGGNETTIENIEPPKLDAKKRGVIVFGTMALLATCYYVFKAFRKRRHSSDNVLSFDPNEQFRYGILNSNESRDNYEMANVPLTADSDDEDEMEIFDLENRKHMENSQRSKPNGANDALLSKDVEILDLDLPGVTRMPHQAMNDDDLLDLDDAIDEILTKPKDSSKGDITKNNSDFFDNL